MLTSLSRTVLLAVQTHPLAMSPVLLAYMLRGEVIGRMAEKGLANSPHFGVLAEASEEDVAAAIATCLDQRWLTRAAGFYPALRLTVSGDVRLVTEHPTRCREAAPDAAYKLYHTWRKGTAQAMRTPPYRILPNTILVALAARRPETLNQLLEIPGLGKRRALRYHTDLVAVGRALATPTL